MPPDLAAVPLERVSGRRRLAACALALLEIAAAPADPARAGDVAGQASVIDGDTIEIHGTRVRLYGIDAPEHDQLCRDPHGGHYRCGQVAANALGAFIGRQAVACVEVDRDQYRRSVAVCSAGKVDLADWLVRGGLAIDWPRYSKGDYAAPKPKPTASKAACGADDLSSPGATVNASAPEGGPIAAPTKG